jgi:hypothetical protein
MENLNYITINTLEALKENRELVIAEIKENLGYYDLKDSRENLVTIMSKLAAMVTASNYTSLEWTITESIQECIETTIASLGNSIDMGSVNRENALNNLPSSLR